VRFFDLSVGVAHGWDDASVRQLKKTELDLRYCGIDAVPEHARPSPQDGFAWPIITSLSSCRSLAADGARIFPDIPGCRAMGDSIEQAIENSAREAVWRIERAHDLPVPRSQEAIRADEAWARQRGIDLSNAVISLVALSVHN
jgi:hypothetical protein